MKEREGRAREGKGIDGDCPRLLEAIDGDRLKVLLLFYFFKCNWVSATKDDLFGY